MNFPSSLFRNRDQPPTALTGYRKLDLYRSSGEFSPRAGLGVDADAGRRAFTWRRKSEAVESRASRPHPRQRRDEPSWESRAPPDVTH